LLTESLLLAVLGGAGGIVIAIWGIDVLIALSPDKLPRLQMIRLDTNILAFSMTLTLATGLLFGLAPAAQSSRPNLTVALKEGGRSGTSAGSQRLRRTLVIVEVALAFALLSGAGLLLRSFITLTAQKPGFQAKGVLTMGLWLPPARYDEAGMESFPQRLVERLAALPGVRAAGATSDIPWTGYDDNTGFSIPGR